MRVAPGERAEPLGAQRVEAHRDPVEPGAVEAPAPARRAGRRWSSWRGRASAALRGEHRDEPVRSFRSSGSPPVRRTLSTPRSAKTSTSCADLLEREDVLARQPDVLLLRHAVLAAQVAPVGHRDAEVPERAAERSVTAARSWQVDEDLVPVHGHGKARHLDRRIVGVGAGLDVPAPAVPGTDDEGPVQVAVAQRPAPVRAAVVGGVERRRPR